MGNIFGLSAPYFQQNKNKKLIADSQKPTAYNFSVIS
jgi:hypothetical protein